MPFSAPTAFGVAPRYAWVMRPHAADLAEALRQSAQAGLLAQRVIATTPTQRGHLGGFMRQGAGPSTKAIITILIMIAIARYEPRCLAASRVPP